ncbi:ATP-binding protein [Deinococcus marmoris]|uniref:ATP-binding protein n=1 Tax=Deinococcus marmoris TaxID=249408 RepID=UPI0004979D31|nr:ATP-binding protein [Deinococcus marmoris]
MAKVILPFGSPADADGNAMDDSIYTYEGWRAYVNRKAATQPARLSREEYGALSSADQLAHDEARKNYIMQFGPLNTPMLDMAKKCIKEQTDANMRAPRDQVKPGVVIDGDANLGKTTMAKAIARQFELDIRSRATFPDKDSEHQFIPVVHVTLLRDTTPKDMAQAICEYLHAPTRGRPTESTLVKAIYAAIERHTILMFVIDDIHFLRVHSQSGQETSKFLKSLMSLTGATFVYIGVDVEKMGIFKEQDESSLASSQTASRFIHLPIPPFKKGTDTWVKLLESVEKHLPLLDHEPGTLKRCAALLYNRTNGSVGPLMNLLRTLAVKAVGKGEKIDAASLRSALTDYRSTMEGSLDDVPPPDETPGETP